jgi:hypothetical protein
MIINYYLTVFVSVECHGHHPMYTEGKVLNAANFCQHYIYEEKVQKGIKVTLFSIKQ